MFREPWTDPKVAAWPPSGSFWMLQSQRIAWRGTRRIARASFNMFG